MDDGFILSLEYKRKLYELKAKFCRVGYIHQFHIEVENRTLIFEFDEERNYRVIDGSDSSKAIDPDFLQAIVNKISSLHE